MMSLMKKDRSLMVVVPGRSLDVFGFLGLLVLRLIGS
jgi:hypothetical protein